MQRYNITAVKDGTTERVHLFTWRGPAEAGIAQARIDAWKFGCNDLGDFRAEPITE